MSNKERLQEVGTSLATLLEDAARESGVEIVSKEALDLTLRELKDGNLQALGGIAQALIASARAGYVPRDSVVGSQVYGPDFFARNPVEVARDLCGQVITYSHLDHFFMGVISSTGGYSGIDPEDNRRFPTANAAPGTIGSYNARGPVTIISAHEPDQTGFVAIWSTILPDGTHSSMTNTGRALEVKEHIGDRIGLATSPYRLVLADPRMESALTHASIITDPRDLQRYGPDASFRLKLER